MKKYFVAKLYEIFTPNIIESFDDRADAETYASLMCRTKHEDYIVLERISGWLKSDVEV